MTELLNGYCIDQTSATNFMLKKKYMGKRNGVEQECFKTVSHHTTWEDAAQAFVRLFRAEETDTPIKNIEEYINAVKKANAEAVQAVQESMMKRFVMYVPKGNGVPEDDTVDRFVNLIPFGEENGISRKVLVAKAVNEGLIPEKIKDKDRAMRNLYQDAKIDYAICHTEKGYFRPLPKDHAALKACIKKEDKRAFSILRGNSILKKLEADFDAGRITE